MFPSHDPFAAFGRPLSKDTHQMLHTWGENEKSHDVYDRKGAERYLREHNHTEGLPSTLATARNKAHAKYSTVQANSKGYANLDDQRTHEREIERKAAKVASSDPAYLKEYHEGSRNKAWSMKNDAVKATAAKAAADFQESRKEHEQDHWG